MYQIRRTPGLTEGVTWAATDVEKGQVVAAIAWKVAKTIGSSVNKYAKSRKSVRTRGGFQHVK